MKDRKTFITISTLLAAALIAAITMSAVWITGTYRERQEDFASAVESALLQARLSESRCRESGENGRMFNRLFNKAAGETAILSLKTARGAPRGI